MSRRLFVLSFVSFFLAAVAFAQLQLWPMASILFADGDTLQTKWDERCARALYVGTSGALNLTPMSASGIWNKIVYPQDMLEEIDDRTGEFVVSTIGDDFVELIYNPVDSLPGDFTIQHTTTIAPENDTNTSYQLAMAKRLNAATVPGNVRETPVYQYGMRLGAGFVQLSRMDTWEGATESEVIPGKHRLRNGDNIALWGRRVSGTGGGLTMIGLTIEIREFNCTFQRGVGNI